MEKQQPRPDGLLLPSLSSSWSTGQLREQPLSLPTERRVPRKGSAPSSRPSPSPHPALLSLSVEQKLHVIKLNEERKENRWLHLCRIPGGWWVVSGRGCWVPQPGFKFLLCHRTTCVTLSKLINSEFLLSPHSYNGYKNPCLTSAHEDEITEYPLSCHIAQDTPRVRWLREKLSEVRQTWVRAKDNSAPSTAVPS